MFEEQIVESTTCPVEHINRIVVHSSDMDDGVRPHTYIALRLPSDTIKLVQAVPNTYVI